MKIKDKEMFDQANVFGQGMENSAYAQYFIGKSYLNPLTKLARAPSLWQMSPLSRAAATTGIFITRKQEAARFSSAQQEAAGIRKRAKRL